MTFMHVRDVIYLKLQRDEVLNSCLVEATLGANELGGIVPFEYVMHEVFLRSFSQCFLDLIDKAAKEFLSVHLDAVVGRLTIIILVREDQISRIVCLSFSFI